MCGRSAVELGAGNPVSRLAAARARIAARRVAVALTSILISGPAYGICIPPSPTFATSFPEKAARIEVSDVEGLRRAIVSANERGETEIVLAPGRYRLSEGLILKGDGVVVRGVGVREAVEVLGQGVDGPLRNVFEVQGQRVTIANLSVGEAGDHAIRVRGDLDADGFHGTHLRLFDTGKQIFKVHHVKDGTTADDGLLEWSLIEFSAGHAPNTYTGGIGAIGARNWIVRHNVVRNIRTPPGFRAGPGTAIMFRRKSEGTRIEHNLVLNSDAGIRLGLSDAGHGPGRIVNNWVHTIRDAGIAIEHAHGVTVAHNTVWTGGYLWSIEYRFGDTRDNVIQNNVVSGIIRSREDGSAKVAGNFKFAPSVWFADSGSGDLRLVDSAVAADGLVDKAIPIEGIALDGHCRPRLVGVAPDIGAEEIRASIR